MAFMTAIQLGHRVASITSETRRANDAEYILRQRAGKPLPSHPSLSLLRDIPKDRNGDAKTTHGWVQMCVNQRKLCITVRGYCGLIPGDAQEGDLSCIAFGTKTPCILRKTGTERHYRALGQAFFVSTRAEEGSVYPSRLGSGPYSHENWLKWGLEDQEILLC